MNPPARPIKKSKHVIFLGAGASASSGYPLANDLRLWMSTPSALAQVMHKEVGGNGTWPNVYSQFSTWIQPLETALKLFRDGGFATVDEFCRLAGPRFTNEVAGLKKVLRLALSIHNPEDKFHESDYYGLVQRLFKSDLSNLRDDIVVLTFNYDVYLQFLLWRAARTRTSIQTDDPHAQRFHPDSITSGFHNRDIQYIQESDGFFLLALHGSTAWPRLGLSRNGRDAHCFYGDLFETKPMERLQLLTSQDIGPSDSPIVFPWEIFDDRNEFVDQARFPCRETKNRNGRSHGSYEGEVALFDLFKAIWARARAEVQSADRISVVGLSMHEYLKPAFQFLFHGRKGNVDLTVADQSLKRFKDIEDSNAHFDPLSPVSRLDQLLREICPELRWNEPAGGPVIPHRPPTVDQLSRRPIRIRKSFAEFVLQEMGTQPKPQGVIEVSSSIET